MRINSLKMRFCEDIVNNSPTLRLQLNAFGREQWCRVTVKDFTPYKGIRIAESDRFLLLESRIQAPVTKSGIQYLESEINGVESRIQDCLVFPYMGWKILQRRVQLS